MSIGCAPLRRNRPPKPAARLLSGRFRFDGQMMLGHNRAAVRQDLLGAVVVFRHRRRFAVILKTVRSAGRGSFCQVAQYVGYRRAAEQGQRDEAAFGRG